MISIRLRLLLLWLAVLAAAAAAMGTLTYRSVLAEAEAMFDYQLRQMALSLRDQGEVAADQAVALAAQDLDFVIQIWTVDGRSIYATRPHSDLPTRAQLGLADVAVGAQVWRAYSVATRDRVIQVAQPRQIRRALAVDAALRSIAPLLVLMPALALAAWWLSAVALRPLQRVAAGVRSRHAQSLTPLPVAGLPEEVAPLVQALNGLLERLSQSMDAQQAFVADAAHELRSPLTALKLQLALLERAPDAAARRAAVADLSAGIDRAAWLVEQLLALARAEPAAPPVAMERLDLVEVARAATAATAALAEARAARLVLHAEAPVPVNGNAPGLAALVRNLVDNAVRHGPPNGHVDVFVAVDGGRPLLTVDDAGPGIPPADRERVFDRFVRRAGDAEGSGLGLAIVRNVARQHGAEVTLGESPAGGLRATVRFPVA